MATEKLTGALDRLRAVQEAARAEADRINAEREERDRLQSAAAGSPSTRPGAPGAVIPPGAPAHRP